MKPLSEEQFVEAIKQLDISAENIKIARKVLVEKAPQTTVADIHGITKGRVWQIVKRVREAHEKALIHEGYQRITVVLPEHLIEQVKNWSYKPIK